MLAHKYGIMVRFSHRQIPAYQSTQKFPQKIKYKKPAKKRKTKQQEKNMSYILCYITG